MTVGWAPVLTGGDRARAEQVIQEIAGALQGRDAPDGSLADGDAGIALFFAYLARATGDEAHAQAARERLGRAIEWAADGAPHPYLFHGLTGVAWAVEHVGAVLGDDPGADDDPHVDIDDMVLELLGHPPETLAFELLRGVVGLGVYALERLPRPSAVACVSRAAEVLVAMARRAGGEATWFTARRHLPAGDERGYPDGYHSLGAAHGVPGPIAFLAAASASGHAPAEARTVAEEGLAWLWRQRLDDGVPDGPLFVAIAGERDVPPPGWCYGDAGIAGVLLAATTIAALPGWHERTAEVARRATRRATAGDGRNLLCHGAAGVAHIFHRCHQATGDAALQAAARLWYGDALGLPEYQDAGVLEGIAGVGLALIAATAAIEPGWDRMFLLAPR